MITDYHAKYYAHELSRVGGSGVEPSIILNSFILSWTQYPQLKWDNSQAELESKHVLFMTDDRDRYIDKLFTRIQGAMK